MINEVQVDDLHLRIDVVEANVAVRHP